MQITNENSAGKRIFRAIALTSLLVLGASTAAFAASRSDAAEADRNASAGPQITFADCRMESTPPYEEGNSLECGSGEVIVAVYSNSVRCCALKIS